MMNHVHVHTRAGYPYLYYVPANYGQNEWRLIEQRTQTGTLFHNNFQTVPDCTESHGL